MIERKQTIIYIAKCDGGCGYIIDWDLKHDIFEKKGDLIKVLENDGWQRKGKKWLCPSCQKGKTK